MNKKNMTIVAVVLVVIAILSSLYYYYYILQPSSKKEILIGAAVSQTGSYGPAGRLIIAGYQYWVKEVNEKGGILGKPVRLVLYDDKSDPSMTKTLYTRLITTDKVDLLLGPFSSSCGFMAAQVAEQYKKVILQPINNAKKLYSQGWEYDFMVINSGTTDICLENLFKWLKTLDPPVKTVAIINAAETFSRGMAEPIPSLCDKYNLTLVFTAEIPLGVTDVTSIVMQLKESDADVLILAGAFPEESLVWRTCLTLGYKPKVLSGTQTGLPDFWNSFGQDAVGVIYTPSCFSAYSSYARDFVQGFEKENGFTPDAKVACGYASGQLLQAAIEGAGSTDNDKIREWLLTNEVTLVIGSWKVDHELAKQGLKWCPIVSTKLMQWYPDGEMHTIYPHEDAERKEIYPIP